MAVPAFAKARRLQQHEDAKGGQGRVMQVAICRK
jgi:hypothetical protein